MHPPPFPTGGPRGLPTLKTAFFGILVLACAAVVGLAAISLSRSHEQYRRRTEVEAQNLCTALADSFTAAFDKLDLALVSVKAEVERQVAASGVDAARLAEFIRLHRQWNPVLPDLRVTDSEGVVQWGDDLAPGSRVSVADRDYFRRLREEAGAGLISSKPLMGRVAAARVLILARRIERLDGTFAGVVYGSILLDRLGAHFAPYAIGREGTLVLRDPEFTIIAQRGYPGDLAGTTAASPRFQALARSGAERGTYTSRSRLDGIERIYAFARLKPYGSFVHVGLGLRESLEPWRRELYLTLGLVAAFLALLWGTAGIAVRAWHRLQWAEAERERMIAELQKALADVRTLGGLIPICSNCKKIRDDQGYWNQIETFISSHSSVNFTHGICPDCAKEMFREVFERRETGSEPALSPQTSSSPPRA